jgi:DNA-binding MarR family transcriptional regulator
MEPTDAAALNLVMAEPGISITRLSRALGLSHSATVRAADRLGGGGLVTRTPAGHGRTVALACTERGQRLARQATARRRRVLSHAASGLTAAERQTLLSLLAAIVLKLASDQDQIDHACRLCDQRRCLRRGCLLPA